MKTNQRSSRAVAGVAGAVALFALTVSMWPETAQGQIFQALFSGTGGGTGGASDIVSFGGTGSIVVPPSTSTATGGVQFTSPTLGAGGYLHTEVPSNSGGNGTGVYSLFTPTTVANGWGAMVSKPASQLLVNGALQFFFRINSGSLSAGAALRPLDFGSASSSQVRLVAANSGTNAIRVQLAGPTDWFGTGATTLTFDAPFNLQSTMGQVVNYGLTFSTASATGLTTMTMYAAAGNGAMSTSIGSTTFNINETVMTGSTFFKTDGWSLGDLQRQGGTPKSVDFDSARLWNSAQTAFPGITYSALGAVTVTNPAVSIITGGSAAFTYTVANAALSGNDDLVFSSGSLSGIAGTSSGTVAAGSTSGAISGLSFTGTTVGAGQQGTFSVNAPAAFGGTSATGTVSVDVYAHASGSLSGGTIRVADSIVGYSSALTGLTSATVSNAAGYRVNLKTTGTTSAGGVTINNVSSVVQNTSSTISASVLTGTSTGANAVNQQFTLNYADDSTLMGALSSGLGSGTVTVQGNVYAHASGSATGATIALPDSIVGYTGSLLGLTSATISNAAGYRVNLMTTGGTSAGSVNINNVSGIGAGNAAQIYATAALTGTQAIGSNSLGQTFNLTYADDSALAGASSNLGSQAITVTGRVLDHALPGFQAAGITDPYAQTTLNINFGSIDESAGMQSFTYNLLNLASQTYGAGLTAGLAFTGVTANGNGFASGLSTFSNLVGGGTSSLFTMTFTPSGQGTFNKTFTLSFSDQALSGASARRDLTINAQVIVVPEPGAIALAGIGIAAAAWALRRKEGSFRSSCSRP